MPTFKEMLKGHAHPDEDDVRARTMEKATQDQLDSYRFQTKHQKETWPYEVGMKYGQFKKSTKKSARKK